MSAGAGRPAPTGGERGALATVGDIERDVLRVTSGAVHSSAFAAFALHPKTHQVA